MTANFRWIAAIGLAIATGVPEFARAQESAATPTKIEVTGVDCRRLFRDASALGRCRL